MAKKWSDIEQSQEYNDLTPQQRGVAKAQYWQNVVAKKPEFIDLPEDQKRLATTHFFEGPPKDIRAEKFIPQLTKGMYETVPFGKRVISMMPNADIIKNNIETTPEPTTTKAGLGRLVGQGLGYTPAFEAGAALGGLPMAAIAVGSQATGQAQSEGKGTLDAMKEGAANTAATFVGGKAAQGLGKMVTQIPNALRGVSSRIHDWIIKLPKNSFSYAKNPLKVLSDENIVANTIGDYEKVAEQRLSQRMKELSDAVANNPNVVNLRHQFENKINQALKAAENSLKDRTELTNAIHEFRNRTFEQYGDLTNVKIPEAIKLKRQIADDFPFNALEPKSSTSNTLSRIGHEMHHEINDAVEKVAPNITELNQKVSGLIDIKAAARNRAIVESRQNPIGLIGSLLGLGAAGAGGGALTGRDPLKSGLTTIIAVKALSSPAVLTRIAKALSTMANVDKINVLKAFPFLVKAKHPELQKEILGIEYKPTDIPQYLKERQNIPTMNIPRGSAESSNPIPMKGYVPPGLPSPKVETLIPEYLQKRTDLPIPSLGGREVINIPPTQRNSARFQRPQGPVIDVQKANLINNPEELPKTKPVTNKPGPSMSGQTKKTQTSKPSKKASGLMGLALAGLVGSGAVAGNAEASQTKYPLNDNNAIKTLLGEAENQGLRGMQDIASVIRNRKTLQGAYGINAIIEKDGNYYRKGPKGLRQISDKIVEQARKAWQNSKHNNTANGAKHWFSAEDMKTAKVQKMVKNMEFVKKSGTQSLYRE